MKLIITVFVLSAAIAGCSSKITRTGYKAPEKKYVYDNSCKVALKFRAVLPESSQLKGTIHAGDTGMSLDCNESGVLTKFITEACYLKANVINIKKENHPNIVSLCYRALAEMSYVKDDPLVSDEKFSKDSIYERSVKSNLKAKEMIYGGVIGSAISN